MTPWSSHWWPDIVKTAERGGHTANDVIVEVMKGHAIGWPVDGGYLVLCRTERDELLIWLCAGKNVRSWWRDAERDVSAFARSIGCVALRLEGRKGWRKILPHWTVLSDEDMVLPLANER